MSHGRAGIYTQEAAAAAPTPALVLIVSFHLPYSVSHVWSGIHPGSGGSSHVDAGGASDGVHGTSTSGRKGDCGGQQHQLAKTAREQKGRRTAFFPGENTGESKKGVSILFSQYAPTLTLRQPLFSLPTQSAATTTAGVVIIGIVGQEEQGIGRN